MRPYHEAFPTSAVDGRFGLDSWMFPGAPFCESGVLLPGAAPNAVASANVAANGLSTRNIKHLSSLKLVLRNRMVKVYSPAPSGVNLNPFVPLKWTCNCRKDVVTAVPQELSAILRASP